MTKIPFLYLTGGVSLYRYERSVFKDGRQPILSACNRVFDDIIKRKMYITGGIGSSAKGEAFTVPYDLPNLEAYSESCAALGLQLFAL